MVRIPLKHIVIHTLFTLFSTPLFAQVITTIAGSSSVCSYGGDGGPATAATLCEPTHAAFDKAGNLYIPDEINFRIRKVDASAIISTVAGTGTTGDSGDGGPATAAKIGGIGGVGFDTSGNLYLADEQGNTVRKVDNAGIITTVAGTGVMGFFGDGGPATAAQFNGSENVVADARGNLYISDINNYRLRKVDAAGVISTIAGNGTGYSGDGGPATAAGINPAGMLLDAAGNIIICDWNDNRIRKIDITGIITTIAGTGAAGYSGDGGPATAARLFHPCDVAIDTAGNIFVAEQSNHTVRKIDIAGTITTVAGNGAAGFTGDGGPATAAQLNTPSELVFDGNGDLYVSDMLNNRIRKIAFSTPPDTTIYSDSTLYSRVMPVSEISISPNPVTNIVYVNKLRDLTDYRLTDITGRLLQQGRLSPALNTLSMKELTAGSYILFLINKNENKAVKIDKE